MKTGLSDVGHFNNKIKKKKKMVDLLYIIRYLKYNFNMSKLEMRSIHYVYG